MKTWMRRMIGTCLLAVAAQPASAITLSSGDFVYYGFNAPGSYGAVFVEFNLTNFGSGDSAGFDIFGGIGSPGLRPETSAFPSRPASRGYTFPEVLDGSFLVFLTSVSGTFDAAPCISTGAALGDLRPGQMNCLTPFRTWVNQVPTSAVPEPATLALALVSAVGVLALRRRRVAGQPLQALSRV